MFACRPVYNLLIKTRHLYRWVPRDSIANRAYEQPVNDAKGDSHASFVYRSTSRNPPGKEESDDAKNYRGDRRSLSHRGHADLPARIRGGKRVYGRPSAVRKSQNPRGAEEDQRRDLGR